MTAAAPVDARPTRLPRPGAGELLKRCLTLREGSIAVVTLLAILYSSLKVDRFFTTANFVTLLPYFAPLAILASGEVLLMVQREIDLSIGSVHLFCPCRRGGDDDQRRLAGAVVAGRRAVTAAETPFALDEVATGIHRVESDLGPRFMAQYVLTGTARTVLVDTGLASTPDAVLVPALARLGRAPDLVITSHADVDHCGGNAAIRARFPESRFACHAADRAWIESPAAMLAGNYAWYSHYGFGPSAQDRAFLEAELGGDTPVDDELSDGDVLDLGDGWRLEVLHLPGHTPGHLGLWDPRSRSLLAIDAILDRGIRDRAGRLLIPPRIYDTVAYEATIARVEALAPERLLTAHFNVDVDVDAFLARSRAWDEHVAEAVRDADGDLRELTDHVNQRIGPYPEFGHELAAAVRDHARRRGRDIA